MGTSTNSRVSSSGSVLRYAGERYCPSLPVGRPFEYLDNAGGHTVTELFVPRSIHKLHGPDDTTILGTWESEQRGDEEMFTLRPGSSIWSRKIYRFRCSIQRLRFEVTVRGNGQVAEVHYFAGYCSARTRWGSGFVLSRHAFRRTFSPEPDVRDSIGVDPAVGTQIDCTIAMSFR